MGSKYIDLGHILENIVFLELLRRGYEVYTGKIDNFEVDFIAIKDGYYEYYQVSETVREKSTLERELKPLNKIKDHNPKFLLTIDNVPNVSHNGIRQYFVLDWLLSN